MFFRIVSSLLSNTQRDDVTPPHPPKKKYAEMQGFLREKAPVTATVLRDPMKYTLYKQD